MTIIETTFNFLRILLKMKPICELCGEQFNIKRKELGYDICLECGEELANSNKRLIYETVNTRQERVVMRINK